MCRGRCIAQLTCLAVAAELVPPSCEPAAAAARPAAAQVLALPPEDQRALRPALQHGVLRRLLQSLCGPAAPAGGGAADGGGDGGDGAAGGGPPGGPAARQPESALAEWVANPRVVGLLRNAAKALRRGELREEELERLLLGQLRGSCGPEGGAAGGGGGDGSGLPGGAVAAAGAAAVPQAACAAVLPSHLLAEALNEHVRGRFAGGVRVGSSHVHHAWSRSFHPHPFPCCFGPRRVPT
jgi:hypothetical protein